MRWSVALILALITACGPSAAAPATATPTEAPTPSATASPSPSVAAASLLSGWTATTKKTASGQISIGLPSSWRAIDIDETTLGTTYTSLASSNPDFAAAFTIEQFKTLGRNGIVLWAGDFDPSSTRAGFVANLNVIVVATRTTVSLDVFTQLNQSQIEVQLKAKAVSSSKLKIGSVDAQRVVYEYSLNKPDGTPINATIDQFYLLVDGYPHVLTFTSLKSNYESYRSLFEQIAVTYRVSAAV